MDAVEALEEIAFRLERELASKYRAKAFRKAAAIIQPLSAAEVANRVADGSLKRMAGIGDTTYAVIEQAADGRVPDYLAELRARDAPADAPASGLRTRLRGDLHAHTDWSDGTTSIESMARAAEALGHEYLAITDHSPNLRVANGLSAERLTEQIEIIEGIDAHGGGIRLLTGIEVDILPDGTLDQAPEMLAQLDLVVASVHSKLRTESEAMTRRMLGGVNDPARTSSGTAPAGWCRVRAARVRRRPSTPGGCSPPVPRRMSRSRSTRGPSGRTLPTTSSPWRLPRDACSASTATPTRRVSSACSTSVRLGRRPPVCRRSASSRPGRSRSCWSGRVPPGDAVHAAQSVG